MSTATASPTEIVPRPSGTRFTPNQTLPFVSPAEAHGIIADLVSKDVPLIQVFDGFPRVLRQLRASDHFLVLLYWRGTEGATLDEQKAWARAPMRSQSKRTLNGLDDKDLIHLQGGTYVLTHLGERDVEQRQLLEPQ